MTIKIQKIKIQKISAVMIKWPVQIQSQYCKLTKFSSNNRYRRGNLRIQCSKPLLLQLFGSVALLNISESEACRDEIIEKGGVHYIFEASEKVKDHSDLWFILYYIFTRFTKSGDDRAVYMHPKEIPSLGDIAIRSYASHLLSLNELHEMKPDINLTKSNLQKVLLPKHLKNQLCEINVCALCSRACTASGSLRMYEMKRTKVSKMTWICSKTCAKQDQKFDSRGFFSFSSNSD